MDLEYYFDEYDDNKFTYHANINEVRQYLSNLIFNQYFKDYINQNEEIKIINQIDCFISDNDLEEKLYNEYLDEVMEEFKDKAYEDYKDNNDFEKDPYSYYGLSKDMFL